MFRPTMQSYKQSYKDYTDAVCNAYMAHNVNMLKALENDAKTNNTPHWYSETISDIEDAIRNYMYG